jgi:hypothetical protein
MCRSVNVAVFREVFKFVACIFSEKVVSVRTVMSDRQITRKLMDYLIRFRGERTNMNGGHGLREILFVL